MIGVGDSWPVRIGSVGEVGVSPATVVWRVHGAEEIRVTVIVKATLSIVPEGEMTPRDPDSVVVQEAHHHADSGCSLRAASDLAPYLGQAELLVVGHAYAPVGAHTSMGGARVVVHRDGQILLTKTITVQGDRQLDAHGRLSEPAFYQRMPLIYERAVLHPELNPIGVHPSRGAPNLLHSADPSLPGCFGPLGRHWPVRRRLLGAMDPRQLDGARLDFPEGFPWDYYQVSPPDQRLDFLHGTEGILLGGMHPSLPMVRSRLPGVRAVACVYPDRDREGERLPLWADTMLIDTDRQTCSIVWRGNFGVTDESALRSARVRVGVELPGQPIQFPGEAGGARLPFASVSNEAWPVAEVASAAAEAQHQEAQYQEAQYQEAQYQEAPAAAPVEEAEELPAEALETVEGFEEVEGEAIEAIEDAALETVDGEALEAVEDVEAAPAAEAVPAPVPVAVPAAVAVTASDEDEDVIATRAVGFRSPLAGEAPANYPAPPAMVPPPAYVQQVHPLAGPAPPAMVPPPAYVPPQAPAPAPSEDEDEDAVVTPRGDRPSGS